MTRNDACARLGVTPLLCHCGYRTSVVEPSGVDQSNAHWQEMVRGSEAQRDSAEHVVEWVEAFAAIVANPGGLETVCTTCFGEGECMGMVCYGDAPVERMLPCPDCCRGTTR